MLCCPEQEEDQLIDEWQPDPLVPEDIPRDREVDVSPIVTGYFLCATD